MEYYPEMQPNCGDAPPLPLWGNHLYDVRYSQIPTQQPPMGRQIHDAAASHLLNHLQVAMDVKAIGIRNRVDNRPAHFPRHHINPVLPGQQIDILDAALQDAVSLQSER